MEGPRALGQGPAFSFTELRVLSALADGLTVVEIGEQLGVSHSSVSKALHAAERRTGLQLVEPRGRRIGLTAAGLVLAQAAQAAVREVRSVERSVEQLRAGTRGLLRIVASSTPADHVLPAILGEFLRRRPEVRVSLRVASMPDMRQVLQRGEGDIGVGPPATAPRGWRADPLYIDEMTFFVAAQSDLAGRESVPWEEVRTRTLVGQFMEPAWSQLWAHLARRPFDPEYPVELRTSEAIKRLVEASAGVGVLVRTALAKEIADGRLVPIRVDGFRRTVPYALIYRPLAHPIPVVEEFRQLLVERLKKPDRRRPSPKQ